MKITKWFVERTQLRFKFNRRRSVSTRREKAVCLAGLALFWGTNLAYVPAQEAKPSSSRPNANVLIGENSRLNNSQHDSPLIRRIVLFPVRVGKSVVSVFGQRESHRTGKQDIRTAIYPDITQPSSAIQKDENWLDVSSSPLQIRFSKRDLLFVNRSSKKIVSFRLGCVGGISDNLVISELPVVTTNLEPANALISSITFYRTDLERCKRKNGKLAVVSVGFEDNSSWRAASEQKTRSPQAGPFAATTKPQQTSELLKRTASFSRNANLDAGTVVGSMAFVDDRSPNTLGDAAHVTVELEYKKSVVLLVSNDHGDYVKDFATGTYCLKTARDASGSQLRFSPRQHVCFKVRSSKDTRFDVMLLKP
jgi:hypothetical protein